MPKLKRLAVVGVGLSLICAGTVFADPPGRVGRLSFLAGSVSFAPAGANQQWVTATKNRPISNGDQLWADKSSRAELQLGGAALRLDQNTSVGVLNVDNNTAQFQLNQGSIDLKIRRLTPHQVYEIDTPNLAFTIQQKGNYRIDVDTNGNSTTVTALQGQGQASASNDNYPVNNNQSCTFSGNSVSNAECVDTPQADDFITWCLQRDQHVAHSHSLRYVPPTMVGADDLDDYGDWSDNSDYGHVWYPNETDPNWAPYRHGHWAWINPWGWTWVDDAPWGFAPFHYGRWVMLDGRWAWVPGPVEQPPVYAPALVAFVAGVTAAAIANNSVGWFPLAPNEVYVPPYTVSRNYFINVNVTNTVVNNVVVNKYYNNPNLLISYRNKQIPQAVTAVNKQTFVTAQPVNKGIVPVNKNLIISAPVSTHPNVVPTQKSIIGLAQKTNAVPAASVIARNVITKHTPPPAAPSFAQQQKLIAGNGGRPLSPKIIAGLPTPSQHVVPQPVNHIGGYAGQQHTYAPTAGNIGGNSGKMRPQLPPPSHPSKQNIGGKAGVYHGPTNINPHVVSKNIGGNTGVKPNVPHANHSNLSGQTRHSSERHKNLAGETFHPAAPRYSHPARPSHPAYATGLTPHVQPHYRQPPMARPAAPVFHAAPAYHPAPMVAPSNRKKEPKDHH